MISPLSGVDLLPNRWYVIDFKPTGFNVMALETYESGVFSKDMQEDALGGFLQQFMFMEEDTD